MMADQEIKTGIDALVAYVKEHGETNVSIIASALGVSEAAVLEWANVLEKANMILITHRAGKLFLAPMTGEAKATKETRQAEQERTVQVITTDISAVDQVSAEIDELVSALGAIDSTFETKYKNTKAMLDKLNALDANMSKVQKNIEAKAQYISTVSQKAKEQFETSQANLNNLSNFSLDTNNARAVLQELRDMLRSYEKNTADLAKGLDLVIYQYKKNAMNLSKSIKEKHRQLIEVTSFDQKQIREYERLSQDYKREHAAMTRKSKEISRHVLGEIDKGKSELTKLMELTKAQLGSMRPKVDDIRKDLGGIAALNSEITDLKDSLKELVKQRDALLAELKKLQQSAKAGGNIKKVSDRAEELSGTVTQLREKSAKLRSDFEAMGKGKDKKSKG